MNIIGHFQTITNHRKLVRKYCFAVGLYRQGLFHDLSKYSPTEFWVGAKYFQGDRSPNNAEREAKGYSSSWLHHKGRNKHHNEYWIDYSGKHDTIFAGMEMPLRYVVEMFMDRIAACRIYQKDAYTQKSPLLYYNRGKQFILMHPRSQAILEDLLKRLAYFGEEKTFAYAAALLRKERKEKRQRLIASISPCLQGSKRG